MCNLNVPWAIELFVSCSCTDNLILDFFDWNYFKTASVWIFRIQITRIQAKADFDAKKATKEASKLRVKQIRARAKEGELSLKYKIQKLPPYVSIFILSCCNSACSCSAFLIGVICSRRPGALNSRHNARCCSLPLCRYYWRQQRAICDIYCWPFTTYSPHIYIQPCPLRGHAV